MISKASTQKPRALLSRIQVLNKQRRYKLECVPTAVFCSTVLQELGIADCYFSVTFVNEEEIQKVNSRYLHRNYPTDVLSFVYNEKMEDGKHFLGEIIIAPQVSFRSAKRYHHHPENEIRKLLLHGILHLLGYDHETDDGTMLRLQRRLENRVFFKRGDPLLKTNKAYP